MGPIMTVMAVIAGVVVLGAALAVVGIVSRRDGRGPRWAERGMLGLASALGLLYLALQGWGTWASLHQKLVDGIYSVDLSIQGRALRAPTSGTAHVTNVYEGRATANVSHLSAGLTSLVILDHIASLLLWTLIIGSGIYLCVRSMIGRPFARSMTVALWVTAFALIVVGSGIDVLDSVVANQLQLEAVGADPSPPYEYGTGFEFPGGYLFAGFGVAIVAVAFRAGARASRETEGLV